METKLKKSITNIIKDQIKNLEVVDSLLDIYISSKEFKELNIEQREMILNMKRAQSEHLNTINKYLKY